MPDRCLVCSDDPINKDYKYVSGGFYFDSSGKRVFYCSDCLREPEIEAKFKIERLANEKYSPKKRNSTELADWQKSSFGWAPLATLIALFFLMMFFGVSSEDPAPNDPPAVISDEELQWILDNSIEGPNGTFDNQSKP
jgi:hypothetical protein